MSEKKALVLQHVEGEGPGVVLSAMTAKGFKPVYVKQFRNDVIPLDLDGYSALIVLGGPMGVYEQDVYPFLKDELRLIEEAMERDMPTLGICLGAQLMAAAAGARVYKGKTKEIGWYDVEFTDEAKGDRLLSDFPKRMKVFQWHGDTFDVPAKGARLAASELFPNQAFRLGKRCYGLQFHFEVTAKMIGDFLVAGKDELVTLVGHPEPKRITADTPNHIDNLLARGEIFFNRFFELAG
jgi:GMP synthase-like glutamine amidotransferase